MKDLIGNAGGLICTKHSGSIPSSKNDQSQFYIDIYDVIFENLCSITIFYFLVDRGSYRWKCIPTQQSESMDFKRCRTMLKPAHKA